MHVICKQKLSVLLTSFIVKCTKNCVDMCARHGRGAIETCLSEKGALDKKDWETLPYTVLLSLTELLIALLLTVIVLKSLQFQLL